MRTPEDEKLIAELRARIENYQETSSNPLVGMLAEKMIGTGIMDYVTPKYQKEITLLERVIARLEELTAD